MVLTRFCGKFQSTLPRGSDFFALQAFALVHISIHAPSRERQCSWLPWFSLFWISIHAPSRERRKAGDCMCSVRHFNPRSLAGATVKILVIAVVASISIHAPSRERHRLQYQPCRPLHFNPRSLAGATSFQSLYCQVGPISIHAPSRERPPSVGAGRRCALFQSTLPRGSDAHLLTDYLCWRFKFQSTLPRGSD